jgi:hypothetical protein
MTADAKPTAPDFNDLPLVPEMKLAQMRFQLNQQPSSVTLRTELLKGIEENGK